MEAIEYRGFAFVHVLSPCQTFRPEQRAWKDQVHPCETEVDDALLASRCLQADDGLTLGVLYRHPMSVWQSNRLPQLDLSQIEAEFLR